MKSFMQISTLFFLTDQQFFPGRNKKAADFYLANLN